MKQLRVVIKASRGLQKALKPACTQRGKPLRLTARCVQAFDCLLWEPFEVGCNTRALLGPFLYVKNKLVNERNRKMKLYSVKFR